MKKYVTFALFLVISVPVFCQTQKLIIKTGTTTEVGYWASDGEQLPFYDLAASVTTGAEKETSIDLQKEKTFYSILIGERECFKVYSGRNGVDTVAWYGGELLFSGNNRFYNQYLVEVQKSDDYCREFSRTQNHPLGEVHSVAEFKRIVAGRHKADDDLLGSYPLSPEFKQQQLQLTELKYKALLLKKIISLYKSPHLTDEWIAEFKSTDFHLTDEVSRQSEWFCGILEDYVCISRFILEKEDPQAVAGFYNTFLFENYCKILTGKNLEYAVACQLYSDIFQEDYSKDSPEVYERFLELFPGSRYKNDLMPGIGRIVALYSQKPDNSNIRILRYEAEPESFAEMMRPFAGKVVYIDIWSTTCSPCIRAFAGADKLRQEIPYAGDVVFYYISLDKDSKDEKWRQMMNFYQLEGYHYRVNERTGELIYSTFGDANGRLSIPRYIIAGKDGKIAFPYAASPENPGKVAEQLKTLLK